MVNLLIALALAVDCALGIAYAALVYETIVIRGHRGLAERAFNIVILAGLLAVVAITVVVGVQVLR